MNVTAEICGGMGRKRGPRREGVVAVKRKGSM